MVTAVPKNASAFDDEVLNYNFPAKKNLKLKKLMGYERHRLAPPGMLGSDLALAAFKDLFASGFIKPGDIDAIVYITQSPDYLMPQTSVTLLSRLGLKEDLICFDLNQGCAGFEHGLFQAFMLLETPVIQKVAVVTADALSSKVGPKDRNSFPLVGDAAAVTIVSREAGAGPVNCYNKTFGHGCLAIYIPAGGFRLPCSMETARQQADQDGNIRSSNDLVMEGASVFSFVQEQVPRMVDELLIKAQLQKEDIDHFIFHQPNKFMLEKLADKLGLDHTKMPNNIVENFGNASSVTVPTNLCYNLKESICQSRHRIFFGGFGIGLTVAGVIMNVGPLHYCNLIDVE